MKELQLIFKTREGISLYFDGVLLYTENIKAVKEALLLDYNSGDPISSEFAKNRLDLIEDCLVVEGDVTVRALWCINKLLTNKKRGVSECLKALKAAVKRNYNDDIKALTKALEYII